ncbi:MAG: glutathione S-transferase family protein [Gammaproteobacteria bacterium]|nr:glutathione S-transferase family protein [Gammaproteobacteria bacterium]MCP5424286.1 glutathione S-transferase family protein [Gammaproteobacteria bacterium]MCP5459039.1 glutathione S-transferase family protein [Gammaproteobacteria bacterium]
MMQVFGFPNTRATRVLWALEEIGADYEYVPVDLHKGEGRRPPYVDLNPAGKVPTLLEDGFALSESAAICTFLGDRFPQSGLTPTHGSRERALYNKWCFFVIGELEQPLWTLAKHRFALPEKRRVPAIMETAAWEFGVVANVLNIGLGGREFILGEQFTAADILIAHTLGWALACNLSLGSPSLDRYAQRVLGRPALARARQRESMDQNQGRKTDG